MILRKLFPLLFVGAVGVPLVMWSEGGNFDPAALLGSLESEDEQEVTTAADPEVFRNAAAILAEPAFETSPLLFTPTNSPTDVIRFDINPAWVKQQWPRVSTAPGEPGLYGMRVAVVTGTNPWDLHGSLTYYFDDKQRVQRVSFVGNTGNATPLVNAMIENYGFRAIQGGSTKTYTAKRRGRLYGALQLQHAPVISSQDSNNQLFVALEITQPGSRYSLSSRFAHLSDR